MTGDLELGSAPPTPLLSKDGSSTDVSNWSRLDHSNVKNNRSNNKMFW